MNFKPHKLLISFLIFPAILHAEVFYWQDEQGKRHYSDRPQKNAQTLAIKDTTTYYTVKKVYDGDTITLNNNRRVRLLSINTPEIENAQRQAESGGRAAQQWLQKHLINTRVYLEYDIEKQDKYGRVLAHVFTEDKQHINLELVKLGLASINIYPPNLKHSAKLLQAQENAEQQQLGIWGLKDYQPKPSRKIKSGYYRGWQRISAKVKNIKSARKYHYLKVSKQFSLKIAKSSSPLFPNLKSYVGKNIEARGWIYKQGDKYNMLIRHPSAIKVLN